MVTALERGRRDATSSLYLLSWIVVGPLVGFALAGRVFDLGATGDWEVWKAAMIGILLAAPFAYGAYLGVRAIGEGCRRGWVGAVANGVLTALAVGMPISEALTG
jgi:hypothetical protein